MGTDSKVYGNSKITKKKIDDNKKNAYIRQRK